MSGIQLLPFQSRASQQIVNRYGALVEDARRPWVHQSWKVPFYQALSALTGSGKTPMLADAVSQMRMLMPQQPVVLWISKAKAVVDQTYANFDAGGKYSHLVDGFDVRYLSDVTPELLADGSTPSLLLATVGTFNQKDKGDGTLLVHKSQYDQSQVPLWQSLTVRDAAGERRPLIVVYDEGHNLSDQQTDLLLELEPDAVIVASATMRTPARLGKLIDRLVDHGWSERAEEDAKGEIKRSLVTAVSNKAVVDAGLVKLQVDLGGYTAIMETMIDDLLDRMAVADTSAIDLQAGFSPKAIYVCKTNINQEDGSLDLPSKPFEERRAPPILIWRYLVEQKKIDPSEIAVYCDLKFSRSEHKPPPEFKLYSGGDQDFASFSSGNYRHIIFNQSLQEGWDDPACCFAYIDKSMGSQVQVEQVIGRVLRQPNAEHFTDPLLNTASFFIRVDNKQEFPRILKAVQEKLAAEAPEVKVEGFSDPRDRLRARQEPKKQLSVPEIHIDAEGAVEPLAEAVETIIDFRNAPAESEGKGELVRAVQSIGRGEKAALTIVDTPHSNRVMSRWIVRREIVSLYPEVAKAIDWSLGKFNAPVEITSRAAGALRNEAEKLVDIYLENSDLAAEPVNPYVVGPVTVKPAKSKPFQNALHAEYDLNGLELDVAEALDATGLDWCRNPANGGFSIPLLDKGDTRRFFPDFLVWKDGTVFAIDPKGKMLLMSDAGRKLLSIQNGKGTPSLLVRLITTGRWSDALKQIGAKGYTVWDMARGGKIRGRHRATVQDAVSLALQP